MIPTIVRFERTGWDGSLPFILLLGVGLVRDERSLEVALKDTMLIVLYSKPRIFLFVELDKELGAVEPALLAVPLDKVLERLVVLQDSAQAR